MCIRRRDNVFYTEPLLINEKGTDILTHRLMGGFYEVPR
jgi:hypothetical protein